jgi:hypothetical protein
MVAGPLQAQAQPVSETALAAVLTQQETSRGRLQEAERRLAQARADAQREADAIATRIRAETAPLVRRLDALQAAPARAVPPVEEPERLRELTQLLAAREAQLARLVEVRDRASAELRRAQAEAEMAASAVTRAVEAARRAAEAELRADQARARLAGPAATQDQAIRDEAWRQVPRAVRDQAERVFGDSLTDLIASARHAPVEPDRSGRFMMRDLPGGRWWAVGVTGDRRDVLDIWEQTITRDGVVVLGRPLDTDVTELAPADGLPRSSGAYDACLLENLRGVASDMAATAIIGACRARHPGEARYDVTVEVAESNRPPLLMIMAAAELREVAAIFRSYFAALEPAIETAARRIVAQRLPDAEAALASAMAAARTAEAEVARHRAEAERAARRIPEARAVAELAGREVEAFRAEPEGEALASEATSLRADLETRRAEAAARIEAERNRLREEVAAAQGELRQAEARLRAAEEPRRQRAVQLEAAAAAEVEAARRAVSATDAEVPRLRRALAEQWRADYLRQRVSVSLNIAPVPFSSMGDQMFCVSLFNAGELVLMRPRLTIRFRGRTLSELGISPGQFGSGFSSLENPSVSYQNRFNETVVGLRPSTGWGTRQSQNGFDTGCTRISPSSARTGDTGRAFERAGGFSTLSQDWSVSLSADLARVEDIREVPSTFPSSTRRWEHVPSSPETLFAARLGTIRPAPPTTPAAPNSSAPATAQSRTSPTDPLAEPAQPISPAVAGRASQPSATATISITDAQRRLRDLGLYRGALDGLMGPGTRGAIRTFERDRGLPETGELSGRTLEALLAVP